MKIKLKIALGAFISLFVFGGCQRDSVEQRHDPLEENYKLIDRGDYSQAIIELESLVLKDRRPTVRVALASAYAARGGIQIENYWGFIIGFKEPLVSTSSNGLNILAQLERLRERIDSIPTVKGQSLLDLKKASGILLTVQTPGGRLYRAILNLILFKSHVSSSEGTWEEFAEILPELYSGNKEALCRFEPKQFLAWLDPVVFHLVETLNDLSTAFPEDANSFEEGKNLIESIHKLTKESFKELRKSGACK